MIILTDISTAYDQLTHATTAAFIAAETAANAKAALEVARAEATHDGRIDGKNQEQREAQARQVLTCQYNALEVADTAARYTRHGLDLARIEVERVRVILRLAELTSGKVTE